MEISGYRIEREIGHGGMATVYQAEQLSLGRKVALKVMAEAFSSDRTFSDRFLKEAHTQMTRAGMSIGTPHYMSPEQDLSR